MVNYNFGTREDDIANEIASLSLEVNKGRKEEPEEEEVAPVKKKEKVIIINIRMYCIFFEAFSFFGKVEIRPFYDSCAINHIIKLNNCYICVFPLL